MTRSLTMYYKNCITSIELKNFHDSLIILLRKTYKGVWHLDNEKLNRTVPGTIVVKQLREILVSCSNLSGIDFELLETIFLAGQHSYFWIDSIYDFKNNPANTNEALPETEILPGFLQQLFPNTNLIPLEQLAADPVNFSFHTQIPEDLNSNPLWELFLTAPYEYNIVYGTYKLNGSTIFYNVHAIPCALTCEERGTSLISYDAGKVFDPNQDLSMLQPLYYNSHFCYNSKMYESENIITHN